jgi:hypothetical protein
VILADAHAFRHAHSNLRRSFFPYPHTLVFSEHMFGSPFSPRPSVAERGRRRLHIAFIAAWSRPGPMYLLARTLTGAATPRGWRRWRRVHAGASPSSPTCHG